MNLVKNARLSAKEALEGEWLRNVDPTGLVTQILSFGTKYICIFLVSGTLSALNYLSTKIATSCGAKREDELKNEKLR